MKKIVLRDEFEIISIDGVHFQNGIIAINRDTKILKGMVVFYQHSFHIINVYGLYFCRDKFTTMSDFIKDWPELDFFQLLTHATPLP